MPSSLVDIASVLGGFATAAAAVAAIIAIPIAFYQLRHNERQRAIGLLEQSILDHYSRLETRTLDSEKFDFEDDASFVSAMAEVRRLVSLLVLLEQREQFGKLERDPWLLNIFTNVTESLGYWQGFVVGYLGGEFGAQLPNARVSAKRGMIIFDLASCEGVSPKMFEMSQRATGEFKERLTAIRTRAEETGV